MQLGTVQDKLTALGVETVAVVNSPLERARVYVKYRPVRVLLAADPEAATHRAFGLPSGALVEQESEASWLLRRATRAQMKASSINPTGELAAGLPVFAAGKALNEQDGFEWTAIDQQTWNAHGLLPAGHFLIDRDGIIRWLRVEGDDGIDSMCTFPSAEEILAAARGL